MCWSTCELFVKMFNHLFFTYIFILFFNKFRNSSGRLTFLEKFKYDVTLILTLDFFSIKHYIFLHYSLDQMTSYEKSLLLITSTGFFCVGSKILSRFPVVPMLFEYLEESKHLFQVQRKAEEFHCYKKNSLNLVIEKIF